MLGTNFELGFRCGDGAVEAISTDPGYSNLSFVSGGDLQDGQSWALARLADAGVRHALIGGAAANVYRRERRVTKDYDTLVETFDGLRGSLEAAGFELEGRHRGTQDEWLLRASVDGVGFDFSLAEVAVQKIAVERARSNHGVATAEDVILLKLIANRHQDRDDVVSIAKSGRPLDVEYLGRWSAALDEYFGTAPRYLRFLDMVAGYRTEVK